ncbi:MAG: hypothetical protein AAFR84_03310 [Pseudomonadota bacterium]
MRQTGAPTLIRRDQQPAICLTMACASHAAFGVGAMALMALSGCMEATSAGQGSSPEDTTLTAAPAPEADALGLGGAPLQPLLDQDQTEARTAEARAAADGEDAVAASDADEEGGRLRPLLTPKQAAARAEAQRGDASELAVSDDAADAPAETQESAAAEGEESAEDGLAALTEEEEIEIGVPRPAAEPGFVQPLERADGLTWLATGKTLLARRKPAEAEVAFRRSLALEGVSLEALTGAGIAAKAQGHFKAARIMLLRARSLSPNDVDVNNALGLVLMGLNDYPGAYEAFRTAFIVSSGTSEVAAANLEDARIRTAYAATVAPSPDSEAIAFDLSRTGQSEFLLHEPGTAAEAVLPPEEPLSITTVDEETLLAIEEGADPAEVIAEAESAEDVELTPALAAAEPLEAPPAEPVDAASVETEGSETSDGVPSEETEAPAGRDLEAEAALPPELLAIIEGAGGSLAPLEEDAAAARAGSEEVTVGEEASPEADAAPAEGGAAAALATNAAASDGAVIEVDAPGADDAEERGSWAAVRE